MSLAKSNSKLGALQPAFILTGYKGAVNVLDTAVDLPKYRKLPSRGYLDQFLSKRKNSQRFTPVGYGLTKSRPGARRAATHGRKRR